MRPEVLEKIGLTKSEVKVYIALLELGSSTTGKIVDKSKASSSKIYEILDKLMQKGLVSFIIRSGVKYFEAAPPERIMDYMKEKEKEIDQKKEELKKILPELELKRTLSRYKSEATVYKGLKGMETAFYDALGLLGKNDEMLVLGIPERSDAINRFFVKFNKERARRKIKGKYLFNESARNELQAKAESTPYTERRFIPQTTPAAINIFNDRTIIFPESEEVLLIVIDSKEVAESFRVQFEMWWNQSVFTYEGLDGMKKAFFEALDATRPGETVYVYGASTTSKETDEIFYEYNQKRAEKGVKLKIIFNEEAKRSKTTRSAKEEFNPLAEIKFIAHETTPDVYEIFPDRVLITTASKKRPALIVVKNKDFVQTCKIYFDQLWNQDTTVSKGFEALDSALMNLLEDLGPGGSYDVLGAAFGIKGYEKKYAEFFKEFHKIRAKRNISARLLFQQGTEGHMKEYKTEIFKEKGEIKFLPYKSESPVAIFPYNDKTLLVIQQEEPTVIKVNNKQVAQAFKKQFDMLWNQETRVVKGLDAIQELFEEMLEAGHCDFIGARGYFMNLRPKYIDDWEKRAIETGFTMRNIVDPEVKGHRNTRMPFSQTKYTIPKEFSRLSVFWIYGRKVVISNWMGKEPIAIIIENKQLHDMYQEQFNLLWEKEISIK